MKPSLFSILAFLCCVATHSFHIESVSLPSNLDSETDCVVTINVTTPSGNSLYQPTSIVRDHDDVIIMLYPQTGLSGMTGHITETHNLGKLRGGETKLVVVLVPETNQTMWGDKSYSTRIMVAPKLSILERDVGVVIIGPQTNGEYVLEFMKSPSEGEPWSPVIPTSRDNIDPLQRWFLDGWTMTGIFRLRKVEN